MFAWRWSPTIAQRWNPMLGSSVWNESLYCLVRSRPRPGSFWQLSPTRIDTGTGLKRASGRVPSGWRGRSASRRARTNEKVRAARALEHLPLISEAMARGELSFSKVRALTRAAVPENEAELLEFARAGSAANLERLVRGWKTLSRFDEVQQERIRHGRRCFSVFPDEDGMYVVKGRLDPEVGAALMRVVEAASDALFAGARVQPTLILYTMAYTDG